MERIVPIEPRAMEIKVRVSMYSVFLEKLMELNKGGFCHRNIRRTSGSGGHPFENVMLTTSDLGLIDVGISAIRENANEIIFNKYIESELK